MNRKAQKRDGYDIYEEIYEGSLYIEFLLIIFYLFIRILLFIFIK